MLTDIVDIRLNTFQGSDCLTWCYFFIPYFGDWKCAAGKIFHSEKSFDLLTFKTYS